MTKPTPEFTTLPSLPGYLPPLDTGQPNANDLNDLGTKSKATFAARNSIIPITYGRDRLFGQVAVVTLCPTSGCLNVAFSFCEGAIQGFEQFFIGNKDIIADGSAYFGLKNRGFESGTFDHWSGGSTVSNVETKSGSWSGKVASLAGGPNLISDFVPAPAEGSVMRITGSMLPDPLSIPDANASIAIRWYDSGFSAVGTRDNGTPPAGETGTALFGTAAWQDLVTDVTVPATAVYYAFDFGESGGTTGLWYCDDAATFLLNDEGVASAIELVYYTGSQTQVVDSLLASALNGYADTNLGTAYVVGRFPPRSTSGFPRLEAIIQGKKLYDPRKDSTSSVYDVVYAPGTQRENDVSSWEYSANPAIAFRDMITTSTSMGIAEQGVADLADYNDELLSGVPRRAIGLTLAKPSEVDKWISGFRTYMGGFIGWEDGLLRVVPNKPDVEAPGAVVLDATAGTWVDVGDQAELDVGLGDFTVECAFKMTGDSQFLVTKYNTIGYSMFISAGPVFSFLVDDGTNSVTATSAVTINDGEWHTASVAVDRTADTITITIDDVEETPVSISTVTGTLDTTAAFRIGSSSTGTALLNGTVDEVRVWNDVRTTTELTNNRLQEIADPELDATLVGYWKMNEPTSSTTARDSSASANDGTAAGNTVFSNGYAQIIPDGVAMHIGVDDIIQGSLRINRRTLRSVPNSVAVDYEDSSGLKWITSRVQVDSPRVTNQLEARRLSRVSLPGVHNASQAQREATQRLNWYLTDLEATVSLFDEGWALQNGSIVAVTHPLGLDAKLMRVRGINSLSGRWTVDLVEYDPAVYSNEVVSDPTIPDTNLGDPLNPPVVQNLVLAEEYFRYKSGIWGSRVRVTFTPSTFPFLSQYLIEGYVAGVKVWETVSQSSNVVTPGVEEIVIDANSPVDYEVRVYTQSPFASSPATSLSLEILGKFAIPGDVPEISAVQIAAGSVEVSWGSAVDLDIWRYELRRGDPVTNNTWELATRTDLMDDRDRVFTGLATGSYRFFVKAIDSVRQESANAVFVDITLAEPPAVSSLNGFEVASEVRLNWPAVVGGFVERYRIAYSDIPETYETTLDVVDTLRFQTKDVAEGTFTFKVYAQDALGNEATSAATLDIEVTSDADSFLADTYRFVQATTATPTIVTNGSLTNMVEWSVRTDQRKFYVTNMGDTFSVSPSDFVTGVPLANYHSTGASEWLSETKDFELPLTGSWNLTHDVTALSGTYEINLELSTDNVNWSVFGVASKGGYQYARVRISTAASPGTATAFVKSPIMDLKVNVVPLEESGQATSSTTIGKTVNLSREYTAVKEINAQPRDKTDALMAIVDNIIVGPNTGIRSDGTNYLQGGDWAEMDMGTGDFTIEYWTVHDTSATNNQIMMGKRSGAAAGWTVRHDYGDNEIDFIIDDGTNQVAAVTTGDALPNDAAKHHVAITVDRTADQVRIYVDSVEAGGSPYSISTVTGNIDNAVNFNMFASNSGTGVHAAGGLLDDVRIWGDVRTSLERDDNWQSELDMTISQPDLLGYWRMNGVTSSLLAGGDTDDAVAGSTNSLTDTNTGGTGLSYADMGPSSPVQKINSFDVYVFDIFGQQLLEEFQWNWKAV